MSKVEFTDTQAGSSSFPGFLTPIKGDFILTPFTQIKSPEIMTEPSFSLVSWTPPSIHKAHGFALQNIYRDFLHLQSGLYVSTEGGMDPIPGQVTKIPPPLEVQPKIKIKINK